MARTRSTKTVRRRAARSRRPRYGKRSAEIDAKLDRAVLQIKKTSRTDAEAVARIKEVQVKFDLLYGTRPMTRLVGPATIEGIRVTRIEVLLPPGFDGADLPPQGGDPADGNVGDPISKGPPYNTDRSDPEDTNGL